MTLKGAKVKGHGLRKWILFSVKFYFTRNCT